MPIPTELVGSLPRTVYLQQAYADYDSGKITREEFVKVQDKAVENLLTHLKKTGETYLTDGDQRVCSFVMYPVIETLGGKGIADNMAPDGVLFPFDDGHHRQIPRVARGPFNTKSNISASRYNTYAWQNFKLSVAQSKGYPMKQTVISPSMMYLLYPFAEEVPGYPRQQFMNDIVNECEKDIRGCFAAGAKRVSIDFTEERLPGRTALKNDPGNPWTKARLIDTFVDLNNRVLDRFTPAERINIGIHTCPGADCDSNHSFDVPYHALLPSLFKINAGYFLMQLASHTPDIRTSVYQEIGKHIRRDANGVKQVAFIGVTHTLNPTVETPEQVCESLIEASKYIPVDQLGATDDCGFSPFCDDIKPKHGGNLEFAMDVALEKISARIKGAKMASEKLNV
ncbi:hypothetical protein GYMLUDRAFT_1016898 [Collybiopsis luxurians FD-317 M1]|uniref:Cobalamin-independent methionine synthase MetE C-terminal/archaeal domain-containing protein n=1 Tax=Collybiopsis luxurians FD-317 M1 TaxID=944289 RepID=A0A0D0BMP0_9AGAR|nr:hypothetical protein GYMLUDRAFT_1016898 [Collybiopsis luxurians FD-317 M1]